MLCTYVPAGVLDMASVLITSVGLFWQLSCRQYSFFCIAYSRITVSLCCYFASCTGSVV
jgi:hypothetical protein